MQAQTQVPRKAVRAWPVGHTSSQATGQGPRCADAANLKNKTKPNPQKIKRRGPALRGAGEGKEPWGVRRRPAGSRRPFPACGRPSTGWAGGGGGRLASPAAYPQFRSPGRPLTGQGRRGQAHVRGPPARGGCARRVSHGPRGPPVPRAAQTCPRPGGEARGGARGGANWEADPGPQVLPGAPPEGVHAAGKEGVGAAEERGDRGKEGFCKGEGLRGTGDLGEEGP